MTQAATQPKPQWTDAQTRLVLDNMGLAGAVAVAVSDGDYRDLDDHVSEAKIGLCRAALLFNPERKLKFSTLGTIWARWYAAHHAKRKRMPGSRLIAESYRPDGDILANIAVAPEPEVENVERTERVADLMAAVDALPARLATIVRGRLAGETLATVGLKLGITKARVQQLEQRAHKLLRAALVGGTTS